MNPFEASWSHLSLVLETKIIETTANKKAVCPHAKFSPATIKALDVIVPDNTWTVSPLTHRVDPKPRAQLDNLEQRRHCDFALSHLSLLLVG